MLESSLQPFNEAIQDSDWSDSDQSDGAPQLSSDGTPDIDEADGLSRNGDGPKSFETTNETRLKNSKGTDLRTCPRTVYKTLSSRFRPLILS